MSRQCFGTKLASFRKIAELPSSSSEHRCPLLLPLAQEHQCLMPDATSAIGARTAVADDLSLPAGNQLIRRLSSVLGGTPDDQ
jgi:hypothetical protein